MAVFNGDNGANSMLGTSASDKFNAFGGDDTMTGYGGNDLLVGGAGLDTAVFQGASTDYTFTFEVNPFTGTSDPTYGPLALVSVDSVANGDGADTLYDVEHLDFTNGIFNWFDMPIFFYVDPSVNASTNIFLYGGNGNDTLVGHAGDNGFGGGLGNDYIDGGAGYDTVYYYATQAYVPMVDPQGGVHVDLALGTVSGAWGNDTLVSIESVYGSYFADSLYGNDIANYIDGNSGNDTLYGGGGNDVLYGGSGLDWALYAGNVNEYSFSEQEGFVYINDLVGTDGKDEVGHDVERLQFHDIGIAYDLYGNAGTAARLVGALFNGDAVHDPAFMRVAISYVDAGYTADEVAQVGLSYFYSGYSNSQIAQLLYFNLFDQHVSASSVSWVTDLINQYGAANIVAAAGNLAENDTNIGFAGLVENGVDFLPII